jgi:uncharacterized protein YecT (DUF1311 family)
MYCRFAKLLPPYSKSRSILLLVNLLCYSVQAWAGFVGDRPTCDLNGSTPEINACALQDFENADRILNSEYSRLRRSLTSSERTKLQKEQRGWLKVRDVE